MPRVSGKELSDRAWAIYAVTGFLFTTANNESAIAHPGGLSEGAALVAKALYAFRARP
jgi:hypothetical protein